MHSVCYTSCQAGSPDSCGIAPKQEIKAWSYLHLASADVFQVLFVIHVFVVTFVIIVPSATALIVPSSTIFLIFLLLMKLHYPGVLAAAPSSPACSATAGSCTLQSLLCGLALLHTHL